MSKPRYEGFTIRDFIDTIEDLKGYVHNPFLGDCTCGLSKAKGEV